MSRRIDRVNELLKREISSILQRDFEWDGSLVTVNAVEVSPDKQGRVLVPTSLQEAAGLSGTVLVSGNLDRVELWNPATYSEDIREPVDDLGNFVHRLFG